jgi:hypothetical protein
MPAPAFFLWLVVYNYEIRQESSGENHAELIITTQYLNNIKVNVAVPRLSDSLNGSGHGCLKSRWRSEVLLLAPANLLQWDFSRR